ncbi:MAG TPA: DUF5947 family protein [Actinomycetospora sp.]|nr:DUF5947 family protein [Actinomycetospora sp.]
MTASLRRFLTPRADTAPAPAVERCELCAAEVAPDHPHLVDVAGRALKCACRPCALLFVDRTREMAGTAYRTVPDRYLHDPEFTLTDEWWDALQIPVGMAFFLRSTREPADGAVVVCYPSPAGATESELDLSAFVDGVGAGRLGAVLEPDVEALLVRHDETRSECLLVPVDACYRLVGLVRRYWRGFDGGADAWRHIDRFFDDARARARDVGGVRR